MLKVVLLNILLGFVTITSAQQVAFPGAEGFGKFATGGRGGKVLVVSNLNDSGPGSLREAIRQKFPRIIVFSVSGTINLESTLDVNYGDLTIAGQSAPGEGITLKNYPIKIKGDNVIIRYIRSRLGDEKQVQDDAISIIRCKNVIVDHCSFSWATDECASFYDNENLTIQYCIISESLNNSVHFKGEHGYGGIWGGRGASFHHNLFASHKSRNPRFNGARYHKQPELEIVDFRNNVIYNWQDNNSYGGEEGNHNMIGNVYKPGPATRNKLDKILDPFEPYGKFYLKDNILIGNENVSGNNWKGVYCDSTALEKIRLDEPITVPEVKTEPALEAFETVLSTSGASYQRDAVDIRLAEELKAGKTTFGNGIIDTPSQVGGWPQLKPGVARTDRDSDGLPDEWEMANNLNPENPEDSGKISGSGYANIEIYLNSLVK